MLLWILLAALYLMALFVLGLTTLRKGHTVLFWVGIFLPFLWIVGALVHPTDSALAAEGGRAV
jgi:ATP/ADP translocase